MFIFEWKSEEKNKNDTLKHLERELKSIATTDETDEKSEDTVNDRSIYFEMFFPSMKNKSSSTDQIIDLPCYLFKQVTVNFMKTLQ